MQIFVIMQKICLTVIIFSFYLYKLIQKKAALIKPKKNEILNTLSITLMRFQIVGVPASSKHLYSVFIPSIFYDYECNDDVSINNSWNFTFSICFIDSNWKVNISLVSIYKIVAKKQIALSWFSSLFKYFLALVRLFRNIC